MLGLGREGMRERWDPNGIRHQISRDQKRALSHQTGTARAGSSALAHRRKVNLVLTQPCSVFCFSPRRLRLAYFLQDPQRESSSIPTSSAGILFFPPPCADLIRNPFGPSDFPFFFHPFSPLNTQSRIHYSLLDYYQEFCWLVMYIALRNLSFVT